MKELQIALRKVLKETGTPAVGLAMVQGDSVLLVTGMGKADLGKNRDADENTMFRIGSVSKMFASLAILKLQEEGRVSLKDKVRDLAPDVAFVNPWEDDAPVRVEHLLEHTTGWDDLHLADYALNDPELSLKQGLDYHPHSRTSRWMPGTRMSYSNSGPPVAAYIIEKITGQTFEHYIQEHFFSPMGMETMTYFATDLYKRSGATLYLENKPQKYWNISVRPSGSINASAKDMARMLGFFIQRGRVDSLRILSEKSLERMEMSATTIGAKQGLEYGYGLSNYSSPYKSYVYRSHGGGVNGGLTDFSYLPDHRAGYAIMINSGDGNALYRIQQLVRSFQTHHLKSDKTIRSDSSAFVPDTDINGYYTLINPRIQAGDYLDRIINVQHIWGKGKFIFSSNVFGRGVETYQAITDHQFISNQTGKISMVKAYDPVAGDVLQADTQVLKRVSPVVAFGRLILLGLWTCYLIGSVIFGIIRLARYRMGKAGRLTHQTIGLWPVIASLLFICASIMASIGGKDPFELLGKISFVSVSIMALTIGFALATAWSVIRIALERKTMLSRNIYIHIGILTALHLVVACYLLWHGVIGIQTWN
ncbi:serine hydrolase [Dyadobacter sp. CY323]|uniref:serine hydrolase domain-containing protein n=1 Tax=Dyadobacter sp. CY323 TaxID=2907302 RepID=UPI001F2734DC|nr:serine hydrolase domain-containing protein [Dyadobacter sp. CY323]MCE6991452.1 beta-lactamase family protein [Dyadobacter sp. CY323]